MANSNQFCCYNNSLVGLSYHTTLLPYRLLADAIELPHDDSDDVAVEFDNVFFHYPTQPSSNGLRGLSFKMKRGTTTAVVGTTGAGKVSYL